jgi:hypothetical protein
VRAPGGVTQQSGSSKSVRPSSSSSRQFPHCSLGGSELVVVDEVEVVDVGRSVDDEVLELVMLLVVGDTVVLVVEGARVVEVVVLGSEVVVEGIVDVVVDVVVASVVVVVVTPPAWASEPSDVSQQRAKQTGRIVPVMMVRRRKGGQGNRRREA